MTICFIEYRIILLTDSISIFQVFIHFASKQTEETESVDP